MPTLRCTTCGAKYYTAATTELLKLVVSTFRCEVCREDDPLQVVDAGVGYLAAARRAD
jgi:hypothetical protein